MHKGFALWDSPHIFAGAGEFAAGDQAGELLYEQTTLAATAEAEFADELFVAGLATGGAADAGQQVAVAAGGLVAISARMGSPGHGLRRAYAREAREQAQQPRRSIPCGRLAPYERE